MSTHQEMVRLQAEEHGLIDLNSSYTKEEYVLNLIHAFAYYQASKLCLNKNVLDYGCNAGHGSEILSRRATKVTGVDVSTSAIETAKKITKVENLKFRLVDGKALPFKDNEYDIVVSCQVVEHIVDVDKYLEELKRVLKPDGVLFITTPNVVLRLDAGMEPWNRFHVREYNYSDLDGLLNKHFMSVSILGLFAESGIYDVEKKRLTKAKERAKQKHRPIGYLLNKLKIFIKNSLPQNFIIKIKKLKYNYMSEEAKEKKKGEIISREEFEKVYYQYSNLNEALDLMAICSETRKSVEDALGKIQRKKG